MKFLITFLLVLIFAPVAHAETLYGFMDGKYYDQNSTLKVLCFLDNNCYDTYGNFAFKRITLNPTPMPDISTGISTPEVAPLENPVKSSVPDVPRCIDEPVKADYSTQMVCYYNSINTYTKQAITPTIDVMFLQQHIDGSGITITARTGQKIIIDNDNNEVRKL